MFRLILRLFRFDINEIVLLVLLLVNGRILNITRSIKFTWGHTGSNESPPSPFLISVTG